MKKQSELPQGWDQARVRRVLKHHEAQSDVAAVAEDEAAFEMTPHTAMELPIDLVAAVQLIAKRESGAWPKKDDG